MNKQSFNTYQSVTLWHYTNGFDCDFAQICTVVRNMKLNKNSWTSYEQGKKELARLALRLGEMPSVTKYGDFTCYSLNGFLD